MKRERKPKKKANEEFSVSNLVLVRMVVHRWRGRHIHRGLGNEMANSKEADRDTISAIVKYMPPEVQEKIQKAVRKLKVDYRAYSLPWEDKSWRVLRADQFDTFMKRVQVSHKEFQDVVDELLENYDDIKKLAKKKLNRLYEESKFPSKEKLSTLYGVDICSSGIANPEDIRVSGLSKDREIEIRKSMEQQLQERVRDAVGSITIKLKKMVEDSLERYSKTEQDGVRYRGLQQNVEETCDKLEMLNITGDAELKNMIDLTRHTLTKFKPIDLRTNKTTLNIAKKEAQKVMSALDNFGM